MDHPRRIALLVDRGLSFARGIIQGVRAYADRKPHWVLRDGPPRSQLVAYVRDWKPHGIIAGLVVARVARELSELRIPVVDTASTLSELEVPTVDVDHTAVGRLAAEYFLDRQFHHFGYFGSQSAAYSRIQESAFRQHVTQAGHDVASCHTEYLADLTTPVPWKKTAQKTHQWLRQLTKPAAILCSEDAPARYLADACAHIGLRIPDDIALLGVGNDPLDCNLTQPELSSIAVPSQRIGYEAAAMLDRWMAGGAEPRRSVLLLPLHVVTRHSTDIAAVRDEAVQAALRYIRRHVRENISVGDVAREIAVSRRLLERRFRSVLGRTVLDEIVRVRVERAKELLIDTHLPVATIAGQCGFSSVNRMDVHFARLTGASPTAYRRQADVH
jgi:LacI family transcriptional regulator